MCNLWSGHVVTDKESKDWGKVLLITGIHHEKDRENKKVSKYKSNLLAWETIKEGSFNKGVKITHDCGQNISSKEKKALIELVNTWGQNQKRIDLLSKITGSDYAYYFIRDCKPSKEEREIAFNKITESNDAYSFIKDCKPSKAERKIAFNKITKSYDTYLFIRDCNPSKAEREILKEKGLIA